MNIQFEKANWSHRDIISEWLNEPHVQEFWDNSQGHKDDILNFLNGRIEPSTYADGLYSYWVGLMDGKVYSLFMTFHETSDQSRPQIKDAHLSKTGETYSIDYMIGNRNYFGKGLGAQTLESFIDFFHEKIDPRSDTFFIDPDLSNPRAKYVYEKAGFTYIGDFIMEGDGVFAGHKSHFLVKKLGLSIMLATLSDYPVIQNMARFYVYDASLECGLMSKDWAMPNDGLYESFDFKCYFEDPQRKAFLIKMNNELAGFALLHQTESIWHIGEFFILARFQRKKIGTYVAHHIWNTHPGLWEVFIIPENSRALSFWRKATARFSATEMLRQVEYDHDQPQRVVLNFSTKFYAT